MSGQCGNLSVSSDFATSKFFSQTKEALKIYSEEEDSTGVYYFYWNASLSKSPNVIKQYILVV